SHDTASAVLYTLSLHDALPIWLIEAHGSELVELAALEVGTPVATNSIARGLSWIRYYAGWADKVEGTITEPIGAKGLAYSLHERSEEHTSELQSRENLVCRLLL